MKKRNLITSLFISTYFVLVVLSPLPVFGQSFADVSPGHWAYADIEQAFQDQVITGTGIDPSTGLAQFNPGASLTTAEFITILGRAYYPDDLKQASGQGPWYQAAMTVAQKHNLLTNFPDHHDYQMPLSRYQVAVILANLLKNYDFALPDQNRQTLLKQKIIDYPLFANSPAESSVLMIYNLGLLTSTDSAGSFTGQKLFTRAEVAAIYRRLNTFLDRKIRPLNQENPALANKDQGLDYLTNRVVFLVNQERAKRGIHPLKPNPTLAQYAQIRSSEIGQVFAHTRPNGQSWSTVLDPAEFKYLIIAENIAYGQTSPEEVVLDWMNSEGHRKNILNQKFNQIGVGYDNNRWVQWFAD